MRKLYTHARNIYLINQTLEQRLALQPAPPGRLQFIRSLIRRRPEEEPVVDGFTFSENHIHAASPRVFRDQNIRPLSSMFRPGFRFLRRQTTSE